MNERYRFFPSAEDEVDRAFDYFVEIGLPDTAFDFMDAVHRTAAHVATQPKLYTHHPYYTNLPHGVRRCSVKDFESYTMYFMIAEDGVLEVFSVIHGARDHGSLLKGRSK